MVDEGYSTRSKYAVFHMAVNSETADKLQAEVDANTGLKDSILEVKSVDLTDDDGNAKTIKRLQGRPKYRDLDNV